MVGIEKPPVKKLSFIDNSETFVLLESSVAELVLRWVLGLNAKKKRRSHENGVNVLVTRLDRRVVAVASYLLDCKNCEANWQKTYYDEYRRMINAADKQEVEVLNNFWNADSNTKLLKR